MNEPTPPRFNDRKMTSNIDNIITPMSIHKMNNGMFPNTCFVDLVSALPGDKSSMTNPAGA